MLGVFTLRIFIVFTVVMHVLLRVKYLILAITSNNMVTKEGVF